MRAAVFSSPGTIELRDMDRGRACAPGEVEIEVEACGICGTDLHILEDPPGHPADLGVILGHEFVGIVVAVGEGVISPCVGERVASESTVACGMCNPCKLGMTSQCENFTSMGIFRDGGLAERVFAPARLCHVVSKDLAPEVAALAEPLSCVVNGFKTARPMVADKVAVIGGGAVGLLYAALYRKAGACQVVVIEPTEHRRRVAVRMGATSAVSPHDLTEDRHGTFDITVDAVGSQMSLAMDLARSGGQVLLFGLNSKVTNRLQQYEIARRELTVHGVYVGSHVFPRAIRVLEESGIDFTPMIATYPLDHIHEAVKRLRSGVDVKSVIRM